MNVLIVLFGAIGDVTRGLSLVTHLKECWPDARIFWAVEPASRDLVEGHPAVFRAITFDRKLGLKGYIRFVRELQRQKYELTIDLQRHFKSGVTSFLSRSARRIGYHPRNTKEGNWLFQTEYIPPIEEFSPKILQYQEFGRVLGLPPPDRLDFGLEPPPAKLDEVFAILSEHAQAAGLTLEQFSRRVALVIGSSWPSRWWTVDRYVELVERLWNSHRIVSLLVGGPGEAAFAEDIRKRCSPQAIMSLVGKTRLGDLAAVFRSMHAVVASDSGPMHIAAAVGVPVVSLWGSTSADRSAPYGSEHLVIKASIGCSPCFRKLCPGLGTLCMKEISVEMVLKQLEKVLNEGL